jgi:hypothetical protein
MITLSLMQLSVWAILTALGLTISFWMGVIFGWDHPERPYESLPKQTTDALPPVACDQCGGATYFVFPVGEKLVCEECSKTNPWRTR